MNRAFWERYTAYLTLALGITFFAAGFKPLMKVAATWLPFEGLREVLAA